MLQAGVLHDGKSCGYKIFRSVLAHPLVVCKIAMRFIQFPVTPEVCKGLCEDTIFLSFDKDVCANSVG